MRPLVFLTVTLFVLPAFGIDRTFDLEGSLDQTPPGFRSTVAGAGKPGQWKVILDDVPSAGGVSNATGTNKRAVLAQLAREPIDTHFPILVLDQETFGDFKLTTRFKIAGGAFEQMAGVVFRFQNESNFYVVRASALGKNFRCYKVENGILKPPLGPDMEISKGVWHTLLVQCEGSRILCALDGNEAIKLVDNSSKAPGKIGFWTKSDSVSHFVDTRITYTPHETLAEKLVREALKDYPRVADLKIFAARSSGDAVSIVASKNEKEIGQPGGRTEQDVLAQGTSYYNKGKGTVSLTLPLKDRNGDPIAAVLVVLNSFAGQTEENAMLRAQPIVKQMQVRVQSLEALLE
jgi:hypothetical protein